jgi:hypothetical protein
MADWSRRFFGLIELPGGRTLVTLRDAAYFIVAFLHRLRL